MQTTRRSIDRISSGFTLTNVGTRSQIVKRLKLHHRLHRLTWTLGHKHIMWSWSDTFCCNVGTVRSLWCTQTWTYMRLKSILTSRCWTVPLMHHRLLSNTPVGFTRAALLQNTEYSHMHTDVNTHTHTQSYKPRCHHCFVNVGQCVSIPNTTERRRRRRRRSEKQPRMNQPNVLICNGSFAAPLPRGNMGALSPCQPDLPSSSSSSSSFFQWCVCVCVCVCGKGLAGGCMYECTMYVCVCMCVYVSTSTHISINSCKLWMTSKLPASQPDLVWRLSV